MPETTHSTQVAIIGGGPGGYTATFMATDLGLQVTLIDLEPDPGGVCLYRGCIPSKALLHLAKVLTESREATHWGIEFGEPTIHLDKMRSWKESVVQKMTQGLGMLCKSRNVQSIQGKASFLDSRTLRVEQNHDEAENLSFENVILATGSQPKILPNLPPNSLHIFDSTGALELREIPSNMLVVGGGYIGLELGSVYAALGSKVSVVEMTPGLLPGVDRDLVDVLSR